MIFIFVFLLLCSHLFLTVADQLSEPLASSDELNSSFLGSRSAITTGVIAAIITIAIMFALKTTKKRVSTEGFGHFSVEVLRCFSFDEILTATKNFSPSSYIGYRGFGDVYGGLIDEGNTVAIKRLSFEFWKEVNVLSKLRHANLVSLIGYCNESRDMILVYEFMPLGTLAYNLCRNTSLSWEKRLRICIGAARGLDYLHTGTDHGVIHGDLKSSSILLDENYKPKISDFGLTKIEETVLQDRNVDNHTSQRLAQKSDVCSFGVVLLEVLCGKTSEDSRDQESQPQLMSWGRSLIGDGHIKQKVDPHLKGQISPECLNAFVVMSQKCLHDDPNKRPTMVQLVAWLEQLLDYHVSRESNSRIDAIPSILEATRGNAEPKMREASSGNTSSIRPQPTEPSHSNEELIFSDEIFQCQSMKSFVTATQSFNTRYILHEGAYYTIYRGKDISLNLLADASLIYTWTYIPDDISKLREVSHLSHSNLASMDGYCSSGGKTIVGYKNEGRGLLISLLDHSLLSWLNRLKILVGAADALRCLHTAKIIHGGISPCTILVDSRYSAKLVTIGYFLTHLSAQDAGLRRQLLLLSRGIEGHTEHSEKSDVYMFGLLLFIVFCGKKVDRSGGYPFHLTSYVTEAKEKKYLYDITDMNSTEVDSKCLSKFLIIAFSCCTPKPVDRPSMDAVLEGLKKARALQTNAINLQRGVSIL